MKKWMFVALVISFVMVLSACGSTQNSSAIPTASTGLSLEGQLLVGTFKLESTSLAVTSAQADQLLPLWETLQSLASSGTAATQELDAVISQIESTMSAKQISSITAMNLSQQDLVAASADTGATTTTSSSANTTSTNAALLQGGTGAPGAGSPPADMGSGIPVSGGVPSTTGQAQTGPTQTVTAQATGTSNQVPTALINVLVELLKKKIG